MPFPLTGQDRVEGLLRARLARGDLPQAVLLSGPQGSGKTELVGWLATALLCPAGGCGSCASCTIAAAGNHPDRHALELERKAGRYEIPVGEVERICAELRLAPHFRSTRVAILEDAESLSEEAQNSLLKTLEEPRAGTWLLLTARRPEALLPTVISRVMRVHLRSLRPDEVERRLAALGHPPSRARDLAVAWCHGSPGLALRLLELDPPRLEARLLPLFTAPESLEPARVAAEWLEPREGQKPSRSENTERVAFLFALLPRVARTSLASDPAAPYAPDVFERFDLLVEECLESGMDLALNLDPALVVEAMVVRWSDRVRATG
jgi:DNA polymerase-3 subunit delta'